MNQVVQSYYDSTVEREWARLERPLGRVELASTLWLVGRYFPARGRICDIGGGPGRYTVELLRRGYAVTLFDLPPAAVAFAHARLAQLGLAAEGLSVGNAQDLQGLASGSFDAALLMGPLYHLVDPKARGRALGELRRILKPGGVAILSYLNTWGILRTGVVDFAHWYGDIAGLRALLNEQAFAAASLPNFTESYWATPPSAVAEVRRANLEVVSYAGAESFVSGMGPLLEQLAADRPGAYANVVQVAAETCELAQYRDGADHLHIVVRKPH